MTYSPPSSGEPSPQVLSTMTRPLCAAAFQAAATGSSAVWPAANLAVFFPVRLGQPRTFTTAWWLNGATAAGNVDVGIYTIAGTTATLVAASTAEAQAGTSAMQVAATFPSTTVGPGLYYLAMSCSSASATVWRSNVTTVTLRPMAVFQAATSHPLPSSATVVAIANSLIPVFGLSELSTI